MRLNLSLLSHIRPVKSGIIALAALLCAPGTGLAASPACSSVLTEQQRADLDGLFFHKYSPNLSQADPDDAAQGFVKRLDRAQIQRSLGLEAQPRTYALGQATLSDELVAALRTWFKSNPPADLPAWASSRRDPTPPDAWKGQTVEDFIHLMTSSGDVGPIKTTTLVAGDPVGIAIKEHIVGDASGNPKFLWAYMYQVIAGGRMLTTYLAICQADVLIMSDDERDLRAMEQQLARAWATRDRLTVERILARDWSVTTADGSTLSRAMLLGETFDATARVVEAMATDDVTVKLLEGTAIVRGRTVATIAIAGARETTAVRFTDFWIKRDGLWQIAASHQTRVPTP